MGRYAVAIAAALGASLCLAAVALGLPPFTTAPKSSAGGSGQAELYSLAVGCHPSFDRVVVRARFATPGYDVRYVNRIVADPSGTRSRSRAPSASASSSVTRAGTPPPARACCPPR